jgi:hypothetical protein
MIQGMIAMKIAECRIPSVEQPFELCSGKTLVKQPLLFYFADILRGCKKMPDVFILYILA